MRRDPLVTDHEAAAALDVPVSTIRVWKTRGRVVPAGLQRVHQPGTQNVPLYVLDELRPLADDYHRRRAARDQSRTR